MRNSRICNRDFYIRERYNLNRDVWVDFVFGLFFPVIPGQTEGKVVTVTTLSSKLCRSFNTFIFFYKYSEKEWFINVKLILESKISHSSVFFNTIEVLNHIKFFVDFRRNW